MTISNGIPNFIQPSALGGSSILMTPELYNPAERSSSPDIVEGATLLSHLRHFCENCGTFATPQWRKGWHSEVLNRSVLLCNACGLKYHKNQFCPYCFYVYGKEQHKTPNHWLTCQMCGRWVHGECEEALGGGSYDRNQLYACPECRKRTVAFPASSQ